MSYSELRDVPKNGSVPAMDLRSAPQDQVSRLAARPQEDAKTLWNLDSFAPLKTAGALRIDGARTYADRCTLRNCKGDKALSAVDTGFSSVTKWHKMSHFQEGLGLLQARFSSPRTELAGAPWRSDKLHAEAR